MSGNIIKFSRNTENAPKSPVSTQTVAFSHYNNISAQLPVDPKTGEIVAGDIKEQAKQCLANIKAIVESIDHVMGDVVKINVFLKNISDLDVVDAVYATFFQSYLPTRTTVAVAALPMDALVQIDAVISNGEGTPSQESGDLMDSSNYQVQNFMREMAYHYQVRNSMRDQMRIGGQFFFDHSSFKQSGKVARNTENEPGKFARNPEPYPGKVARNTENAPKSSVSTQTVAFSHYNNISAQLPIDPKSGGLIAGGVKEQAGQCLKNIKAILESIDVPFDDIVKINIFLKNLSDIEAVNEVYTTFFPDSGIARTAGYVPVRTIVAASAIPMDALVQIDAVVSHGDGTPPQAVEDRHGLVIRANNTENAPKSSLYTQTVSFSHYNHIAAQLPIDPKSGRLVAGGVKEQAGQCLKNIKAIVESVAHVMDDVVKINIQLKNIADIDTVNEVYTAFFKSDLPARTTVGVSAILMDALVQIDAVVSNGEGTPPGS
jgi:reactive intermediate/imine deaminase